MEKNPHIPVMLNDILELLKDKKIHSFLDCTVGAGGHAKEILENHPSIKEFTGVDRDYSAIKLARENLSSISESRDIDIKWIRNNFGDIYKNIKSKKFDLILMDLGVSSMQLDNKERGFSFMKDGPLDMRMDSSQRLNAYKVVNDYKIDQLTKLLKEHDVIFPKSIAATIIKNRPIKTTTQLSELINSLLRSKNIKSDKNLSTLAFQAIRIHVNDELKSIEKSLDFLLDFLNENGVIIIISFHSLEDRIIKNKFKEWSGNSWLTKDPFTGKPMAKGKNVFRKPLTPKDDEIQDNIRSRSAKLRAFIKSNL